MKAIKILDTDEKSSHIALNNFMGWTIDKENHILRLHRLVDGDDYFDNIQLSYPYIYPSSNFKFSTVILKLMEEFLADDDAYILDISEYVNQYVMSRGTPNEEEDNPSIFDAFMEQLKKDRALTTEDDRCDYYDGGKIGSCNRCQLKAEAPKKWCEHCNEGKCLYKLTIHT